MKRLSSTKNDILDIAQALMQTKGYNGFSYADVSAMVGVRKASIHHHFPSKIDLAIEVIRRYRDMFNSSLLKIAEEKSSWIEKVRAYATLYEQVLQDDKLCLCGMLASDIETLPSEVRIEIQQFFSDNVTWLMKVLSLDDLHITESKQQLTQLSWQIISSLQGSVIMARMFGNPEIFSSATEQLMISLEKI